MGGGWVLDRVRDVSGNFVVLRFNTKLVRNPFGVGFIYKNKVKKLWTENWRIA